MIETKNKRYIPKENIVYWCPITKEMDYLVNALIDDLKTREGHHPPKFQMIDECIKETAKRVGIKNGSQFVIGNKNE